MTVVITLLICLVMTKPNDLEVQGRYIQYTSTQFIYLANGHFLYCRQNLKTVIMGYIK